MGAPRGAIFWKVSRRRNRAACHAVESHRLLSQSCEIPLAASTSSTGRCGQGQCGPIAPSSPFSGCETGTCITKNSLTVKHQTCEQTNTLPGAGWYSMGLAGNLIPSASISCHTWPKDSCAGVTHNAGATQGKIPCWAAICGPLVLLDEHRNSRRRTKFCEKHQRAAHTTAHVVTNRGTISIRKW